MMKNIMLLSIFLCAIVLCACEKNKENYNAQQTAFEKFLTDSDNEFFALKNDIQKEEYIKEYEHNLFELVSKEKIFVNWEGRINEIRMEAKDSITAVKFTIFYEPDKLHKREFECVYLVKTSKLDSDPIYSKIKTMSNRSLVYFDGFIRTNNSNNIVYCTNYSLNLHPELPRPSFKFWILDISTESHEDLSKNLKEALEYGRQYVSVLKKNYLREITDKEQKDELSKIKPQLDTAKSKLLESELEYMNRYTEALLLQLFAE